MARKKKRSGKKPSAWSPVTKGGIRVGTTAMYTGVISAAHEEGGAIEGVSAWKQVKAGNYSVALRAFGKALNPMTNTSGKIVLGGALTALIGKGKKIGPFRLS